MAVRKTSSRRGRERRTSERADARLSMRVDAGAVAGATRIVTESQNISASGVYCHASNYLAPLSKVQLTIVLPKVPGSAGGPQELAKCDGIVVRCSQRPGGRSDTPYDLACMFSGIEASIRARIEEFVTWRNLQALRAALANTPAAERKKVMRLAPAPRDAARKPVAARSSKPASSARKPAKQATKQATKRAATKPTRPTAKQAAQRAGRPAR